MLKINLIGASRQVEDIKAILALRKLWKRDKATISTYAEHQWSLLEACDFDEVDWLCMFQDRIVRRRYDKRLRDMLYRVKLPCVECGALTLRPKWVRTVFCSKECREEFSRLDLLPTAEQRSRYPVVHIGARSLTPLFSYNTEYRAGKLRTVNRACLT